MNVWLDDIRPAPKGWTHVKTPGEAQRLLSTGLVQAISLDHDLGLDRYAQIYEKEPTGYDVLTWMERKIVRDPDFYPPDIITIHTANPVAHQKMEAAVRSIQRLVERRTKTPNYA